MRKRILIVVGLALWQVVSSNAAPSLPIVRPIVSPALSYTGPTNDANAAMGQWFQNLTTSGLENRTHEFYDNTPATGGGALGHLAISGVVVSVETAPIIPFGQKIVSFDVLATVYNDAATLGGGAWTNGINSHNETNNTQRLYTNTLNQVILTVDFATCGKVIQNPNPAYSDPYSAYIVATNQDYASWFCWNQNRPDTIQFGDFFVPGWDFGSLLPGQSTNRLLHFAVYDATLFPTGISSLDDARYGIITNSLNSQSDIFINRSSSLKISTWISTPAADDGSIDYPVDGDHFLGNVSVFHNIEGDPDVKIAGTGYQALPPAFIINSIGSSGVLMQILQSSTNLMTTNWVNVATNLSWPLPQINSWTNPVSGSNSVNFYRIVQ